MGDGVRTCAAGPAVRSVALISPPGGAPPIGSEIVMQCLEPRLARPAFPRGASITARLPGHRAAVTHGMTDSLFLAAHAVPGMPRVCGLAFDKDLVYTPALHWP